MAWIHSSLPVLRRIDIERKTNMLVSNKLKYCSYCRKSKWKLAAIKLAKMESNNLEESVTSLSALETTTVVDTIATAKESNFYRKFRHIPKTLKDMEFLSFKWKGKYNVNYFVDGRNSSEPILLVHGFGASIGHWRKNIPFFVEAGYRVYAVDLLGFGASEKPRLNEYSLELWKELLVDFCCHMQRDKKWVLCGNSIGALLCLMVGSDFPNLVDSLILLNCAGGLTSFRESELSFPGAVLYRLVRLLLFNSLTGPLFFRSFRTRENILKLLNQVYIDKGAVDEYLLEILHLPSLDEGAEHVFLKTLGGSPGPSPEKLLPNISCPILMLWGEDDPWTPYRKGFHPGIKFPEYNKNLKLISLPKTGHCPHDERPQQVHEILLPWLQNNKNI
ncbi:hypothetical protein GpartN1_g6217.t1 [Galdieria partita]|uniref:AB hydrolase-1 domain-containing protein n=1 Tax=Galdieria partita TaxID=83374 RepID=A0A9C7USV6_9RHOD|nr:hypothetical protein GpartN1_g6217.t1 [Galdieria partita]